MAATLTADQEQMVYFSFPIEKREETEALNPVDGTPDIWIVGKATDATLDGDQEIVDPEFSAKELQRWADTGGNVRMGHDPKRPVGKGHEVRVTTDGHWVKSLICDPLAKHFIRQGVLNDYSVGISNPAFKYRDQKLDPLGKARRIITGHEDGSSRISELSVVDRGSNFNSRFTVVRKSAGGRDELVGEMTGDPDEITGAAPAEIVKASGFGGDGDLVTVDVPKSASITFSPADLAKLSAHRRIAQDREDAALAAVKAAEAQVYKRDIDTATRRRLASQGRALPDGSYPVETHEDAGNAVTLALSGHGDVPAAKKLIRRVARKEGWADILARLDGKKKGGTDGASKGAAVSGQPEPQVTAKDADPETVKADPGDEDGDGALHHDDGQDDDTDSDADALDKAAAPKKPKVSCGNCGRKCKPSAKFCAGCGRPMKASARVGKASQPTPGDGVTGSAAADVQPAPAHREPDGPAIEALEHDAHLPTVPDPAQCEMKAAARHRTLGVPYDAGWLHDVLCPAYEPSDVARHYPRRDLSLVDEHAWQAKALDLAAKAPLDEARNAMDLWQHARTLKALTPELAADLAAQAHKSFTDANPGPGSAPTPGEISASRFSRPYITAGHAAPSPGHDGPRTAPIHPGHVSAADYTRGPLTGGHAADSPSNSGTMSPAPPPAVPGVPSAVSTQDIQRRNAAQAMSAMHDHIAVSFPDLCPMYGPGHAGQAPSGARPVAAGVGGPVPHGASKADGGGAPAQDPQAAALAKAAKLERKLAKARAAAGIKGEPATLKNIAPDVLKAVLKAAVRDALRAETVLLEPATLQASNFAADPEVLKTAVTEATADLRSELAGLRKVADAIADQPDPRVEAYRAPVFNKTSAPAVPAPGPAGYEDRVRANVLSTMYDQWRNSASPELREEAWKFLLKDAGIDMTKST